MPYVSTQDNRYIGEHSCSNYHFGNMAMVRQCCISDAQIRKENCLRVAISTSHPAYKIFRDSFDALTDAERRIVGDLRQVFDHGPAGFESIGY